MDANEVLVCAGTACVWVWWTRRSRGAPYSSPSAMGSSSAVPTMYPYLSFLSLSPSLLCWALGDSKVRVWFKLLPCVSQFISFSRRTFKVHQLNPVCMIVSTHHFHLWLLEYGDYLPYMMTIPLVGWKPWESDDCLYNGMTYIPQHEDFTPKNIT